MSSLHTSSRFKFSLKPMLLAATLGLTAVGASFAGDGHQHDPAARMAQHLSLDDSQKASVGAIFERNRPARDALHARSKAHFEALRALDPRSADYSARAQTLADEAGSLARDRVLQRTQLNAELATVLNAEQMTKLRAHGGRRHHGGGHRKGPKPDAENAG